MRELRGWKKSRCTESHRPFLHMPYFVCVAFQNTFWISRLFLLYHILFVIVRKEILPSCVVLNVRSSSRGAVINAVDPQCRDSVRKGVGSQLPTWSADNSHCAVIYLSRWTTTCTTTWNHRHQLLYFMISMHETSCRWAAATICLRPGLLRKPAAAALSQAGRAGPDQPIRAIQPAGRTDRRQTASSLNAPCAWA